MDFFVAMQNRRATASYLHPLTIISERNEFLIVSRSGGRNGYLSVSVAGACTGIEGEAPGELLPDLVLCATLVSQGPHGDEMFVVERDRPEQVEIQGRFVGGDGYFCLEQSPGHLHLRGTARLPSGPRTTSLAQRCVLFGDNEPGATVHFEAVYVPWSRELLPGGFDSGRRPRTVDVR